MILVSTLAESAMVMVTSEYGEFPVVIETTISGVLVPKIALTLDVSAVNEYLLLYLCSTLILSHNF